MSLRVPSGPAPGLPSSDSRVLGGGLSLRYERRRKQQALDWRNLFFLSLIAREKGWPAKMSSPH